MKRCAALLVGDKWIVKENPTIGELAKLRNRGAIIMFRIVKRSGNQIIKTWITESGKIVVEGIDFL